MGDAHYLPQPTLSEVPGSGARRVARGASGRVAAGALLPRGLHPTTAGGGDRVPEQACGLRHPIPRCGRSDARHRRRATSPRCRDRCSRSAAHLGADPAAPPASALHCPRRWPFAGSNSMGGVQTGVLPAGARPLATVPNIVPRTIAGGVRGRRAAFLRHTRGPGRAQRLRRTSRYPARGRMPSRWGCCHRYCGRHYRSGRGLGGHPLEHSGQTQS